jgi:hypothetical protein
MIKSIRERVRGGVAALVLTAAFTAAVGSFAGQAGAGTLENMERERAILIDTLRAADLDAGERAGKVEISRRRLVDLERMVLRDDSLTGRNTPTVRRAFANYDLTFMVHSASEHQVSVIDIWLAQLGLTTQSLMSTSKGRR